MAVEFAFKYMAFMPCVQHGKIIKMEASDNFPSGILKLLINELINQVQYHGIQSITNIGLSVIIMCWLLVVEFMLK